MEETSSHDGLFHVNCGICVFSRGRACDSAHVCVCNHTWRTSDCKCITRKSALVASLQCGVRLSRRKGSCPFFTTTVCRVAPYRGRRPNRISRVVARLTQFGSAVSLLTPKCLLGARHVGHDMQTSVLVARAVFVLRYWCASSLAFLSPNDSHNIFSVLGKGMDGRSKVDVCSVRTTFSAPHCRHRYLFPRRASWRAAPRCSPSHASWRGQCRVLTRFLNANRN